MRKRIFLLQNATSLKIESIYGLNNDKPTKKYINLAVCRSIKVCSKGENKVQ